ncbi:TldD/PmbA family protein [Pseudaquidulcibacter saccharophilus]|uniref:TldD/PmbA family protein n=1 Tax=Pseudaquidulcibacter saccharophilus TaxID=2831900 RepID=UPI001EFF48F2|nr:metallopeptidase TldD-related protein [Pseudaquidulcibacter saccharophilus]
MQNSQTNQTAKQLFDATEYLLKKAKELGAEHADCACNASQSLGISVRLGELENVEREESLAAGLRVIIGKKQAGASTSALTKNALDELATRVVAMAKMAAEDKYCTLPDKDLMASEIIDLKMRDETAPDINYLEKIALECEAGAQSIKGISNTAGCGSQWGSSDVVYGSSNGFIGGYGGTSWGLGIAAIAQDGDDMERDYESTSTRFLKTLENAREIGEKAGHKTVARLGSKKMASTKAPVILHTRVARSMLGLLISAISGSSVARGVSFLRDALETQIFPENITIYDDPLLIGGWGSRPFDGEGVKVSKQEIIQNGVLTSWLLNSSAALQLGLKTNGHASMNPGGSPGVGVSNFILPPTNQSLDDLIKQAGNGLLVTEAMSPSFNPNNGDYSVGVSGFEIVNGQKTGPVSEITIAGNVKDIFKTIIAADDNEHKSSIDCPSLLIPTMTIAGA